MNTENGVTQVSSYEVAEVAAIFTDIKSEAERRRMSGMKWEALDVFVAKQIVDRIKPIFTTRLEEQLKEKDVLIEEFTRQMELLKEGLDTVNEDYDKAVENLAQARSRVEDLEAQVHLLQYKGEQPVIKIPDNITIKHELNLGKDQRNLLTKLAFLVGPDSNRNLQKWVEK